MLDAKKNQVTSLLQSGQFQRARQLCMELYKLNNHDAGVLYLMSLSHSQLGEYAEAIKGYKKTLKLSPNFPEAHYNLALTYQLTGQLAEAAKYYRRAIQLRPSLTDAHYNLGNVLFALNEQGKAAACFRTVLKQYPDHLDAMMNLGSVLLVMEDTKNAETLLRSAIRKKGYTAPAFLNLGRMYQTRSEFGKALEFYNKALEQNPEFPEAWLNMGTLYEATGQLDDAMAAYVNAIKYNPVLVDAMSGIGSVLFQQGKLRAAEEYQKKALELDGRHKNSYTCLGMIKLIQGDYEQALEYAKKAIGIQKDFTDAIVLRAKIHEQKGDTDRAWKAIRHIIDNKIAHAPAGAVYANICHKRKEYAKGIGYLEFLLEKTTLNNWGQRQAHFALGKLFDAAGDYDKAFTHYRTGNELKLARYDPEIHSRFISDMIAMFPENYNKQLPVSTIETQRPVFIVGMPRSGTSLIEQIMACHPAIAGGGELEFIHDIVFSELEKPGQEPYPLNLRSLSVDRITALAGKYLERISSLCENEYLVTDKLPGNFAHLGLISLLFPHARVIHCVRNPIDTCLSCYFQEFSGDLAYAYNLEHLAHYYREYRRLMLHWHKVLKNPVLTVQYEALIDDLEARCREIIGFCDLEWDPACLDFSSSDRFVRTASYDQVRRPVYRSSMGRWKKYEKYIDVLKQLPDWLHRP